MNDLTPGISAQYCHTQKAPMGVLLLAFSGYVFFRLNDLGDETSRMAVTGVGILLFVLGLSFHSLTVEDQEFTLLVRFGPFPLFRRSVEYSDVASAEVGRTLVSDGWGIHYSRKGGWVWNLWGRDCVVVTFRNEKILRIGTDDAARLKDFLNTRITA